MAGLVESEEHVQLGVDIVGAVGEVGPRPVRHHAPPPELLTLCRHRTLRKPGEDIILIISPSQFPAVSLAGNVPDLLRPELLLVPALDCLHLYGQPVAVPAGHIVHPPPSGHLPRSHSINCHYLKTLSTCYSDLVTGGDILQDLVDSVAHVRGPVGVRGTVVEDEVTLAAWKMLMNNNMLCPSQPLTGCSVVPLPLVLGVEPALGGDLLVLRRPLLALHPGRETGARQKQGVGIPGNVMNTFLVRDYGGSFMVLLRTFWMVPWRWVEAAWPYT